jgi:hypothetical protein
MKVARTCKWINGKIVFDPPYTEEEWRAMARLWVDLKYAEHGPFVLPETKEDAR